MIVVDMNVIVYLLTDTPQRRMAVRLYEHDEEWRVPPLWRREILNVLASLARNGVLDADTALQLWRNAVDLFVPKEQSPDMKDALALAIDRGVSAYDAQYVALAAALNTQLVSEDKKLQRRFPERVASMEQIVGTV